MGHVHYNIICHERNSRWETDCPIHSILKKTYYSDHRNVARGLFLGESKNSSVAPNVMYYLIFVTVFNFFYCIDSLIDWRCFTAFFHNFHIFSQNLQFELVTYFELWINWALIFLHPNGGYEPVSQSSSLA